jgi:hypothetical protein
MLSVTWGEEEWRIRFDVEKMREVVEWHAEEGGRWNFNGGIFQESQPC